MERILLAGNPWDILKKDGPTDVLMGVPGDAGATSVVKDSIGDIYTLMLIIAIVIFGITIALAWKKFAWARTGEERAEAKGELMFKCLIGVMIFGGSWFLNLLFDVLRKMSAL